MNKYRALYRDPADNRTFAVTLELEIEGMGGKVEDVFLSLFPHLATCLLHVEKVS